MCVPGLGNRLLPHIYAKGNNIFNIIGGTYLIPK